MHNVWRLQDTSNNDNNRNFGSNRIRTSFSRTFNDHIWVVHPSVHPLQFNPRDKFKTYSIRHRKRFHYYKQTNIYLKSISEELLIYNEIKYIYFHNISSIQTDFNHIIFKNIYYVQQYITYCKCFICIYLWSSKVSLLSNSYYQQTIRYVIRLIPL